jgi:hypothetical protein
MPAVAADQQPSTADRHAHELTLTLDRHCGGNPTMVAERAVSPPSRCVVRRVILCKDVLHADKRLWQRRKFDYEYDA